MHTGLSFLTGEENRWKNTASYMPTVYQVTETEEVPVFMELTF